MRAVAAAGCRGVALAVSLLVAANVWAQPEQRGAGIYRTVCALCHETHIGPPILGRRLPSGVVERIVRRGAGAMPSFRPSEIDDETLGTLASFVEYSSVDEAVK